MQIQNRWACIATDQRIDLTASISSILYKKDSYLPIFEFPSVTCPYSQSRDVNEDGYFSRVLGERASYRINNALARVQPQEILLVGMSALQKSYLDVLLPKDKMHDVSSIDEFLEMFPGLDIPHDIL